MTTQRRTLQTTFTGTGASSRPKFVPAAPVTAGLIRRYTTESLDASLVGTAIGSLPDLGAGTTPFAQATAAKRPTLRQSGAYRYLEFDGVDDELTGGATGTGARTIAAVVRYRDAAAPSGDNWPALALSNGGAGAYSLGAGGVMLAYSSAAITGGGAPGTTPHVFLAVFNGATSFVRMDATEVTGNTGNLPNGLNLNVGHGTGAGFAKLDGYEWLVWDRALDATERTKVVTDLRAKYAI